MGKQTRVLLVLVVSVVLVYVVIFSAWRNWVLVYPVKASDDPWHASNATQVAAGEAMPRNEKDDGEGQLISVTLNGPVTSADLELFHQLMWERVQQLRTGCRQVPPKAKSLSRHVLVMTEKKIVWCPVFKAGTSTWRYYLLDIYPNLDEKAKQEIRIKFKDRTDQITKFITRAMPSDRLLKFMNQNKDDTVSFIVVRHPFHRLVAAFRDKIERLHAAQEPKDDYFFRLHGKKIVSRYRAKALKLFKEDFFSEANNFGAPVPSKTRRTPEMPMFWEFVQYVLDTDVPLMDEHWQPITEYCSVCQIPYRYIIRIEDNLLEERYLMQLLEPARVVGRLWKNHKNETHSIEELTKIYFDLLSDSDIKRLYKIYEHDFKLFGYVFTFRGFSFPEVP